MTELMNAVRMAAFRLAAVFMASLAVVATTLAATPQPHVCQLMPDGKLGSVGVTLDRPSTGAYTINSVFKFAPVAGVRRYTLTVVEYSINTSPATLGRSLSIDLDNLPGHFNEYELNLLADGLIGRVNHGGAVALTNAKGIEQLEAYYGAITGRAEISCSTPTEGIKITNFRYQPGSPFPGYFGTMRGTVTNTGSTPVTGIDFSFTSTPEVAVFEPEVVGLNPSVSPRIALLAPGEVREFLVPSHLQVDVGDLQRYHIAFQMSGTGSTGTVVATATAASGLDLTFYYLTIYEKVRALLFESLTPLTKLVDGYANLSFLGGHRVGALEGSINAFQEMGDGLLDAGSLLKDAANDPSGTRKVLTDKAEKIAQVMREYTSTRTKKQMAADLAGAGVTMSKAAVGQAWDWLGEVNAAYAKGDSREAARLISKASTEAAVGEVVVEAAAAKMFKKLVSDNLPRLLNKVRKRAPDAPLEGAPEVDFKRNVLDEIEDFNDLPTGVPLPGTAVARAGLTPDEHGALIQVAKHFDNEVAFFIRPRPPEAVEWAYRGYNAKPMAIKLKSVTNIDVDYLGYDSFADKKGLVALREPVKPDAKIRADIRAGKLKLDDPKIKEIVDRYNERKAEWDKSGGEEYIRKLNAENDGRGLKIYRYGKEVYTKISRDPDGLIRMDYNHGKPVYSDVDLLHIARPDGSQLSPERHKKVSEMMGAIIDRQHGDTFASSDFANGELAGKFADEYGREHMRGGEPLLIVTGDATTAGYVKDFELPADWGEGSNYDLFGKVKATYEGAVFR